MRRSGAKSWTTWAASKWHSGSWTLRAKVSRASHHLMPSCALNTTRPGYISHLDFRKALYIHCGLPYSAVGVLMGAYLFINCTRLLS